MARQISRRAFLAAGAASTLFTRCSRNPCPVTVPAPALSGCRSGYQFRNWAETISCRPSSYCQPANVEELASLVKRAADSGKKVRPVGAGHSWSPLVLTNDVLVNLDRMQEVISVDAGSLKATVQAGIRLKNLIPALRRHGLGLANLGSITEQSIAGVVATATHGTGLPFGSLSTQVAGMKIVSGAGDVVSFDDEERLKAARVSLGALGIVTEVTLQCVRDYQLDYSAYWCTFDEIVDNLDTLIKENERVRLWWLVWSLGCRQNVIVTTMNPPGTPRGFLGKFRKRGDGGTSPLPMETEKLLERRPRETDPACFELESRTGTYDSVMNVPLLRVLHRECEYAVPLAKTAEALRACKAFFDDSDMKLLMPVEVRFVRRDDNFLSPALGRDVGYVGVSVRENENAVEVFAGFESRMWGLEGRPHWGKFFTLSAQGARDLYPGTYERFCDVRKEMDPGGLFANDQIRQLFG